MLSTEAPAAAVSPAVVKAAEAAEGALRRIRLLGPEGSRTLVGAEAGAEGVPAMLQHKLGTAETGLMVRAATHT